MTVPLITDDHLGGFIRGGDPDTIDPAVWRWLVRTYGPRSVIDIGCGEGHALWWFREKAGIKDVVGVEGSAKALEHSPLADRIILHDYTTGPYEPKREFDLAWSCEFVEHVEEEFVDNFMQTFDSARVVAMTSISSSSHRSIIYCLVSVSAGVKIKGGVKRNAFPAKGTSLMSKSERSSA